MWRTKPYFHNLAYASASPPVWLWSHQAIHSVPIPLGLCPWGRGFHVLSLECSPTSIWPGFTHPSGSICAISSSEKPPAPSCPCGGRWHLYHRSSHRTGAGTAVSPTRLWVPFDVQVCLPSAWGDLEQGEPVSPWSWGGWAGLAYCPSMAEDPWGAGENAESDVRPTGPGKACGNQRQEWVWGTRQTGSHNKTTEEQRPEERWSVCASSRGRVLSSQFPQWWAYSIQDWDCHQMLGKCMLYQQGNLVIHTWEPGCLLFLKLASWGRQGTRDNPI